MVSSLAESTFFLVGSCADGAALSGAGVSSVRGVSANTICVGGVGYAGLADTPDLAPFFLGGSKRLSTPFQVHAGCVCPISPLLWHIANLVQLSSSLGLWFPPETM
jgi:hypothetical protein